MARQHTRRYIWLIDTIHQAGDKGITFQEINDKWHDSRLNEDDEDYKLRTFRDHLNAIYDEFEIEIECNRSTNTYRIASVFVEPGSVKKTLIDALSLNNAMIEAPDLNGSIILNDTFYQDSLQELLNALKEHTAITFRYKRDYASLRREQDKLGIAEKDRIQDIDRQVEFEPYGIYFNTVWFSVGKNMSDGRIHIYATHRMEDIVSLQRNYLVPEDFNVKQFMTDYWVDDDDIEPYPGREPDDAFTLESFEASKGLNLSL